MLVAAYLVYFKFYLDAPAGGADSWGQFGDFLGGLLNPVVGTVTIVLLVRTLIAQEHAIRLQTSELVLARQDFDQQLTETRQSTQALADQHKAIVRQSFEQTFFSWHASYKSLINNLAGETNSKKSGSQSLVDIAGHFRARNSISIPVERSGFVNLVEDTTPFVTFEDAIAAYLHDNGQLLVQRFDRALAAYEQVYRKHHHDLGPIFRTLYRLLDWVDNSEISDEEKWHYIAIARSQLSWGEMYFLAFNGLTYRGRNFVPLMNKYAILDNLESHTDELVAVMRVFLSRTPALNADTRLWKYTPETFSSALAKLRLGIIEAKDI
ncbi:hypothetical protein HMPREF0004_2571 [Achromobacter piechaudii ATCC 43553]|uniref:Phage abortive infection protein n=1 Tax=Achromobacter piechaudii ATCC 43553 TaxID=742159 RepID=D4XAS4_9BURK|nr:hypothetical protein HMPREF0004_2571 [Achromobacter piechaudii ATCC 43553]